MPSEREDISELMESRVEALEERAESRLVITGVRVRGLGLDIVESMQRFDWTTDEGVIGRDDETFLRGGGAGGLSGGRENWRDMANAFILLLNTWWCWLPSAEVNTPQLVAGRGLTTGLGATGGRYEGGAYDGGSVLPGRGLLGRVAELSRSLFS